MKRARPARTSKAPLASREQTLIETIFAPLATSVGAFGLKDDAAVVSAPKGCELVVTTDTLVAGVHFFEDDPADLIAQKALRVNLSDLAAKGAAPTHYLLNISLSDKVTQSWLKLFAKGLARDQVEYGISLLGGDTVSTPGPLTISITAFGSVTKGKMIRRGRAKPGDLIYVSGAIGDASLGLGVMRGGKTAPSLSSRDKAFVKKRYLLPLPRTDLRACLNKYARAAMDVSDGLAGDLALMCAASGVTAEVIASDIPLSAAARRACVSDSSLIAQLITGGDDYELLCAIAPKNADGFERAAKRAGVEVSPLGRFKKGIGVPVFIGADAKPLKLKTLSYSHI